MGVLVIGGNGFLGKKLVNELADYYCVSITQRKKERVCDNVVNSFTTGDLRDFSDWDSVLHGITSVIHLASCAHKHASVMLKTEEGNYEALQKLLTACKKNNVEKFIYFSTAYVHGKASDNVVNENSSLAIGDDYARLRLNAEGLVIDTCKSSGIDYIIVRPSLILTSDAPGSIKFLSNMVMKFRFFPFKGFSNKRSYLSVDKLVNFIKICLNTQRANSNVFLLSDNETKSLSQVLYFLAHEKKVGIQNFYFPPALLRFLLRSIAQREREAVLFGNFIVDSSKANELLNSQHSR